MIIVLMTISLIVLWLSSIAEHKSKLKHELYQVRDLKNEVSKLNNNLKLLNKMKNKEEVK